VRKEWDVDGLVDDSICALNAERFSRPLRDDRSSGNDPSMNPVAIFRLRQIPALYRPPCGKSAVAQAVNRTKMIHVKHFGTIEPRNRTKNRVRPALKRFART
jgi:hypothetical protein